jgi:hypothetical protein
MSGIGPLARLSIADLIMRDEDGIVIRGIEAGALTAGLTWRTLPAG